MLKAVTKKELCQISLTGARAIILLGLLMEAPRSLEEIKQLFIQYGLMKEDASYDVIRIDLNTLKLAGCEISRAGASTDHKYKLLSHPFSLDITPEEISVIKKAYNKIKSSLSINTLIQYDLLFKKIAKFVNNLEVKEKLYGISPLKYYKYDFIKELQEDCNHNRILKILYRDPVTKKTNELDVSASQLVFKNDKIYLFGYNLNLKAAITLNIKRIVKILSRKNSDGNIKLIPITVTFKLTNFGSEGLDENEKIIEGNISEGFIIKGQYHNEFLAIQRILSFGSACTVIKPNDFKEKIIESLKKMKEIYNE